jgi:hypothetical protein
LARRFAASNLAGALSASPEWALEPSVGSAREGGLSDCDKDVSLTTPTVGWETVRDARADATSTNAEERETAASAATKVLTTKRPHRWHRTPGDRTGRLPRDAPRMFMV